MERTIFALFDDALAALGAAGALEREGYPREAVSLLVPDPRGRYARVDEPAPPSDRGPRQRVFQPLQFPELGPAAITGPLTPALTGDERGATLVDALAALGLPDPAARHYFESMRRGQATLAVQVPDDAARNTVDLLRRLHARAVDDTGAPTRAPEPALPSAPPARDDVRDQVTVPVVEEHLEIGKRQVQRGGVRIHSHVVEEPVEERVSLREERVTVERRPVYRDATDDDLADFQEGSIEIHETIEEPVIVKRRRVVEEIVVGKQTRERTETISDTIRKQHVSVEPISGGDPDSAARYGAALARDDRYRGARWSDIEPHARREWETVENAGPWEQIKDAVRGAWQKVSGQSGRVPEHE